MAEDDFNAPVENTRDTGESNLESSQLDFRSVSGSNDNNAWKDAKASDTGSSGAQQFLNDVPLTLTDDSSASSKSNNSDSKSGGDKSPTPPPDKWASTPRNDSVGSGIDDASQANKPQDGGNNRANGPAGARAPEDVPPGTEKKDDPVPGEVQPQAPKTANAEGHRTASDTSYSNRLDKDTSENTDLSHKQQDKDLDKAQKELDNMKPGEVMKFNDGTVHKTHINGKDVFSVTNKEGKADVVNAEGAKLSKDEHGEYHMNGTRIGPSVGENNKSIVRLGKR